MATGVVRRKTCGEGELERFAMGGKTRSRSMEKIEVDYLDCIQKTYEVMEKPGLLLVSVDSGNRPNVMTIGVGLVGPFLGRGVFVIWVRPSRYTYNLVEETGDFTVNVPPGGMDEVVSYCGTVSGRNHDKFREKNLNAVPSRFVKSPVIGECIIHYECKIVQKNDVVPETLSDWMKKELYPQDDYHRLYFGEVVATYADKGFMEKLKSHKV